MEVRRRVADEPSLRRHKAAGGVQAEVSGESPLGPMAGFIGMELDKERDKERDKE